MLTIDSKFNVGAAWQLINPPADFLPTRNILKSALNKNEIVILGGRTRNLFSKIPLPSYIAILDVRTEQMITEIGG